MTKTPKIGALKPYESLNLVPAQNGGWVVYSQPEERGGRAGMLGAYTNAEDMIEALSSALLPIPTMESK